MAYISAKKGQQGHIIGPCNMKNVKSFLSYILYSCLLLGYKYQCAVTGTQWETIMAASMYLIGDRAIWQISQYC